MTHYANKVNRLFQIVTYGARLAHNFKQRASHCISNPKRYEAWQKGYKNNNIELFIDISDLRYRTANNERKKQKQTTLTSDNDVRFIENAHFSTSFPLDCFQIVEHKELDNDENAAVRDNTVVT